MRDFIRRLTSGAVFGLGILVAIPLAVALQPFTGVSGTNPILGVPATMVDLNNIINQIAMNFAATTNSAAGEPQFTSAAAFAQKGTVATAMSSVGPVGSNATIQEWLVIVNASGTLRYAPLF
jgi:hypothetical protein